MWCRYGDQECASVSEIGMRALLQRTTILVAHKVKRPYHQLMTILNCSPLS